MIFFYIILAITIAIALNVIRNIWTDPYEDTTEKITYSIFTLFMGVAAGLIALVFTQLIMWGIVGEEQTLDGEASLASLADNQGRSGSFFLGSGSIDDEPVFYYYERNGNEYTLEHVNADNASVIETSDDPRVEFYRPVSNNEFWFMGGMGSSTVKFYVPEGSVLNNYDLDAE